MTPLKSSMMKSAAHNPASRRLSIEFHTGGTHHFEDVDASVHEALCAAESPGKYFHANIKGKFKSVKA